MFNYVTPPEMVFQEVPKEIALCFTITGCPLNCPGCHSADTHDPAAGTPLTLEVFKQWLIDYKQFISCVLFFGGEWEQKYLIKLLKLAHELQLKTCLYTGKNNLPKTVLEHLDYVKYGPWIEDLGGLESEQTNQKLWNLHTGELLNPLIRATRQLDD